MTVETLFAVIAAIGAVVGIFVSLWTAHKKGANEAAVQYGKTSAIETKVDFICDKLNKIENRIENFTNHEVRISGNEKRIDDQEKRIIELEKKGGA